MKQLATAVILSSLLFMNTACEKVEVRPKPASIAPPGDNKLEGDSTPFRKDAPGGLFKNLKWYQYDMLTHIIWPYHDIFAIKTQTRTYLIQLQGFYGQAFNPGTYDVAVRTNEPASEVRRYVVDGVGCGNPYTNTDYENCTKDPARNIFAYLDLDSGASLKMTEAEAAQDAEWDIAFRSTEIRINSGTGFIGQVQGALAYRFPFYFDAAGEPLTGQLRLPSLKAQAQEGFQTFTPKADYDYALPEGIDRILHESFWMKEDPATGLRTALSPAGALKTWILRARDERTLARAQIPLIEEQALPEGGFISKIHLRLQRKLPGEADFAAAADDVVIELTTQRRTTHLCLQLHTLELLDCVTAGDAWDLKFTNINRNRGGKWLRDWLFFTGGGAIGPR